MYIITIKINTAGSAEISKLDQKLEFGITSIFSNSYSSADNMSDKLADSSL